ncbi:MAG: DinB family protein [Acidobacteria bacterium]|nr:DinB family protein [Acidobacteriota bacterium]
MAEVWLRGLPVEYDPLRHLLFCTLEQTREEVRGRLEGLADEQVWARPGGLTPIGFHVRHIGESIDRLLTYAEGRQLSEQQLAVLKEELSNELSAVELLGLLESQLDEAKRRVIAMAGADLSGVREIGRRKIEVPLGTLLAHIAEHTQRHLGQLATTAKLLGAR